MAIGSSKTRAAVGKLSPCFSRFVQFFSRSHVQRSRPAMRSYTIVVTMGAISNPGGRLGIMGRSPSATRSETEDPGRLLMLPSRLDKRHSL